jgi:transcriptional regulator with GAF, ATPase, and Fis domain/ligand-binding sensor protein
MPRDGINWQDVLELHVIRKLAEILRRRWSLGLCFADAEGRPVLLPEAQPYLPPAPLCDVIQSRPAGDRACAEAFDEIAGQVLGQPPGRLVRVTCHAGLGRIAAPITLDGSALGFVWVGGFLVDGDGDLQLDRRAEAIGLVSASLRAATARQGRLSAPDLEYLSELVRLIAEEIVTYQGQVVRRERRRLDAQQVPPTRYSYSAIVGHSRPMQELYRILDKVIDSDSTVLIHGENGTGKELIAKAIHHNSRRKDQPFVVQNCSAFNDNLLDSELFGHKKGAFTGAVFDKQGLFEVADRGTFFLDEIGDMSPALQVKLLRVLQEGTFTPVGDTQPRRVDVRIIAATNRELKRLVERGEFREDLYYRIHVISITAPPLRERRDDIPALIDFFLQKHALGRRVRMKRLERSCLGPLLEYDWPGNVRELENEIERLVVLAGDEKVIGPDLLSPRLHRPPVVARESAGAPSSLPHAVGALERTMIREALERCEGNKTRAALLLGISRRNLIRKVSRYKLDRPRAGPSRRPA